MATSQPKPQANTKHKRKPQQGQESAGPSRPLDSLQSQQPQSQKTQQKQKPPQQKPPQQKPPQQKPPQQKPPQQKPSQQNSQPQQKVPPQKPQKPQQSRKTQKKQNKTSTANLQSNTGQCAAATQIQTPQMNATQRRAQDSNPGQGQRSTRGANTGQDRRPGQGRPPQQTHNPQGQRMPYRAQRVDEVLRSSHIRQQNRPQTNLIAFAEDVEEVSWSFKPALDWHERVRGLIHAAGLSLEFDPFDDSDNCIEEKITNCLGHFECLNERCPSAGNLWSSGYTPIVIRLYPDREYNVKVYFQHCLKCNEIARPRLEESFAEIVAYRLKTWHGFPVEALPYSDKKDKPHLSHLCEGCKNRCCPYTMQANHNRTGRRSGGGGASGGPQAASTRSSLMASSGRILGNQQANPDSSWFYMN